MKLKYSYKKHYLSIIIATVLVILLFSIKPKEKTKKYGKYSSAPDFEQKTPLDFLQITLNEKYYNKLKKKRNKAIKNGVLETDKTDYVPATITFNGEEYKAQIRLKGDWTDHLVGDKWSFRVKLKGNKTIFGMKKFSIHHPKTRGYIYEWLYHKAIKKEGLIGLRYEFVEGSIHIRKKNRKGFINKNLGIYAIEETFDKRMIENNKRKESIILKFTEDYWWTEVKKSTKAGAEYGDSWGEHMNYNLKYPIAVFSESNILKNKTLKTYFKLSKSLLINAKKGNIPINDVFNVKKLALSNAILNLFGANHGNYIINLRFYYNPITSKLEPISFDGNSGWKSNKYTIFNLLEGKDESKNSVYYKELAIALNRISNPKYLDSLIQENSVEIKRYEKILRTEFSKNSDLKIENLIHNQNITIRKELIRLSEKFDLKIDSIKKQPSIKIQLPEKSKWQYINTKLKIESNKDLTYILKRKEKSKSSYTSIDKITVNNGKTYEISILAKKGKKGSFFGLSIRGKYPNRVDAVFDLKNGTIKGVTNSGGFIKKEASIKDLKNGWYKCTLSGVIFSSEIKILFGSTNNKVNTQAWEGATDNEDVFIKPNSIKLNEI